mmetsp:Transcript_48108/g.145304  ORF Transcript_48108/g.145304 Transcript_48108/m.145304 type:complete len:309 (+) Transcript_48108:1272-2198(+)
MITLATRRGRLTVLAQRGSDASEARDLPLDRQGALRTVPIRDGIDLGGAVWRSVVASPPPAAAGAAPRDRNEGGVARYVKRRAPCSVCPGSEGRIDREHLAQHGTWSREADSEVKEISVAVQAAARGPTNPPLGLVTVLSVSMNLIAALVAVVVEAERLSTLRIFEVQQRPQLLPLPLLDEQPRGKSDRSGGGIAPSPAAGAEACLLVTTRGGGGSGRCSPGEVGRRPRPPSEERHGMLPGLVGLAAATRADEAQALVERSPPASNPAPADDKGLGGGAVLEGCPTLGMAVTAVDLRLEMRVLGGAGR